MKGIIVAAFLLFSFTMHAQQKQDSVQVFNAGINGNNTDNLLKRLDRDVLSRDPDLVILMVGTNDMMHPNKSLSIQQYESNYQQLIDRIHKKAHLILMTIPPIYTPYVIKRKPQFNGDEKALQSRMDSANQVICHLAEKNHLPLIDMHHILLACGGANTEKDGLFQNESNFGIADGVHPVAAGCMVIAAAVYQTILGYKPKSKIIVCFGDSITKGYRLKGEGTTEGDTYPAVLKRMLNGEAEN
ncbi:MAG: GDSL-type esterase/lipase family protein [Flavisolibacter sp.]